VTKQRADETRSRLRCSGNYLRDLDPAYVNNPGYSAHAPVWKRPNRVFLPAFVENLLFPSEVL